MELKMHLNIRKLALKLFKLHCLKKMEIIKHVKNYILIGMKKNGFIKYLL